MLNEALKVIRNYHNLSQSQLCQELGISNSYLSEIEAGKKTPTLEFLERFGNHFKIPLSSLMFFSEKMDEKSSLDGVRFSLAKKMVSILKWVQDKSN